MEIVKIKLPSWNNSTSYMTAEKTITLNHRLVEKIRYKVIDRRGWDGYKEVISTKLTGLVYEKHDVIEFK